MVAANFLTKRFGVNWFGNQESVTLGRLKQVVYVEKPNDLEDLQNKIIHTCRQTTAKVIRTSCAQKLRV